MDSLSSLWSTANSCSRMVFREYWCPHTIHHLMVWQKGFVETFKYALESSAADPACTPQQRITRFLLSYRSTPHATTGSSPAKLFLGRELRTCLSLTRPGLASHVACQQGKMKSNHDKHAKFRDVAVGDNVLACDHLSSCKWRSGTVVQQTTPHSYSVQLQDGRTWRRHLHDILLNSSSSEPLKQRKHPLREIFKIPLEKQTAPLQKIVDQRIHPLLLPLLVLNYTDLNAPQNHLRGWLKNFEWTLLCSFEHCQRTFKTVSRTYFRWTFWVSCALHFLISFIAWQFISVGRCYSVE